MAYTVQLSEPLLKLSHIGGGPAMHISPTCVGHDPPLPLFMVPLYQPYPLPRRKKMPKELGATRLQGLMEEAQELSEEEREFEEKVSRKQHTHDSLLNGYRTVCSART